MANLRLSQLAPAAMLTGKELMLLSQASPDVRVSGTNISASAADNSFNDAAGRFEALGFMVGDQVVVSGFASSANNLVSGTVTARTAGKLTIGGTDGDAIVTEAAGASVTIAKWVSVRLTAELLAAYASGALALQCIPVACGTELGPVTAGAAKVSFHMPFAFTLVAVRAGVRTAQASGSLLTVDINANGSSVLSTRITIDNAERLSTTAATPPVISSPVLADGAEVTVDVDQVGDGTATGLKVYLIGVLAP